MSEREGPWPADGDLRELIREASEHRRVWAIVGGLSQKLLKEHKHPVRTPAAEAAQNERIHQLEQKIVKLKKHVTTLEECRAFERETEEKLSDALGKISTIRTSDAARTRATAALHELAHRKGPRPTEADAEA